MLAGSAGEPRPQVVCFAENVKRASAGDPAKTSYTLPKPSGPVVSVDVLANNTRTQPGDATQDVLVIHADGQVVCLSADLTTERWSENLSSLSRSQGSSQEKDGISVEHISYTEAAAARKGLLKGREDVIALLDPTSDGDSGLLEATRLLCVVTAETQSAVTKPQPRKLHLYALRPRSPDSSTSRRPAMQHLLTWDLPTPHVRNHDPARQPLYNIHALSGMLHQLLAGTITTYDLSGTIPRISSELGDDASSFQCFVRLSSSLLLASSPTTCGIYDVKYDSVQAVIPLGSDAEATASNKRKQGNSAANNGSLDLLTYFGDIGLAVGLADDELVGINIGTGVVPSKRTRTAEGLLIDSIGRGIGKKSTRTEKTRPRTLAQPLKDCLLGPTGLLDTTWQEKQAGLDRHLENGDIDEFEKLFAESVGIPLAENTLANGGDAPPKGLPNGIKQPCRANGDIQSDSGVGADGDRVDGTSPVLENSAPVLAEERPLPDWQFPNHISSRYRQAHRHKALYALRKIFSQIPSSDGSFQEEEHMPGSITIQFYPPNVFHWLVISGFLTPDMVTQALRTSSDASHSSTSVASPDIISAIVEYDPEMHLLYSILDGPSHLDISQTTKAIQLLIRSLDNKPIPASTPLLLTNGTTSVADHTNNDENDADLAEAEDAASLDLDHALSTLEDGLAIRSRSLRTALTKLHSFPASHVASALRTTLSHHEIIFLIQILRIELADGGWTARYIDAGPSGRTDEAGDPSDRGIVIIAELLNCALDAIGVAGWLVSGLNAADGGAEDLLHSLRLEISAALEGTHEASFMRGLLDDFCRYGAKKQRTPGLPSARAQRRKGKPVTVALATAEEAAERRILPLGFKVESKVPETKVSAGGQVKVKSKREIGYEISRKVGKYSFERIVI
ncbi:hypothetical protein H2201_006819 [Coniosporium apollinis]|uniref:Anaphase-promoting complex subunit 4 n=1 Tax=Coniosporium apollinis TaxID=61459 RepID=A0ABQ9NKU8_9PEZI|nr:hypothetical protein H2201_006819 [Coniosporium apollinis]